MRIELRVALLLFTIGMLLSRFVESPIACFVVGLCTGLGLLLSFISFLPEKTYDSLLYRRLATVRKRS